MIARFVLVMVVIGGVARAEPSTAEKLYEDGQQAYDGKRYDAAIVAWRKSYELSRLPGLLFNLGQAHRLRAQPDDCARAVGFYKRFLELDPTSAQRGDAEGFIGELAACGAAQPEAPAEPGSTKRLAGRIVAASGIVVLGGGMYFGAKAHALGNEVTKDCADGCNNADIAARDAEGRSAERKQYVFYALGAATLAAGGVVYWLGARERRAATVAVVPHAGGGVVTWSGAW